MDKENNKSKDLDLTHEYFMNKKVTTVKHGHNRSIYYLENNNNQKHVAKKGHQSKDLGSTNLNDIMSQNFIDYMGYDFVPKIISYDAAHDLHIESYVGDRDILFKELNDKQLDTFAKQLHLVHSLPLDKYYEFCNERGFDIPKITTPLDGLELFGFKRFEIVKKLCPDKHVIKWIQDSLNLNKANLKHEINNDAHLKWGDIGENLRIGESGLYFIDWEFSEIGFGHELAYIKIHSHLPLNKFNYLVSRYSFHSGIPIDKLYEEISNEEKVTRTNDVVWAAMKWGQAQTSQDINKYKKLTYARIKLAENA